MIAGFKAGSNHKISRADFIAANELNALNQNAAVTGGYHKAFIQNLDDTAGRTLQGIEFAVSDFQFFSLKGRARPRSRVGAPDEIVYILGGLFPVDDGIGSGNDRLI